MPRDAAKVFRLEQARLVADVFERHGVEYLFIGKGGAILLGYPGATQDVDVFPRRSEANGRRIVQALKELGFTLSRGDERDVVSGKDFVQIGNGPFDLDLVFAPDGIESFDAALRNAERIDNFPVMSIGDIIASKRAAGRKRDLVELPLLEEFRKVYEAAKARRGGN
ncbi:MAG: hypothetical protein ACREUO_02855 [Burkholderiales bacterium]